MRRSERLGVAVSLILLGLIFSTMITLPSRQLVSNVFGSELRLALSGAVQLAVLLGLIAAAGVDAAIRSNPTHAERSLFFTATFWPLPVLVTVISVIWLPMLGWWGYQLLFILLSGALLVLVVFLQYLSVEGVTQSQRLARLTLNAFVFTVALVCFLFLYGLRLRSVISASGVTLTSGMLALDLLRSVAEREPAGPGSARPLVRVWLFAALVGLCMGELTWALNYLNVDTRVGAAFLLIAFYTLVGLSQQRLWGRLTLRVALEYGILSALAITVLGVLAY